MDRNKENNDNNLFNLQVEKIDFILNEFILHTNSLQSSELKKQLTDAINELVFIQEVVELKHLISALKTATPLQKEAVKKELYKKLLNIKNL